MASKFLCDFRQKIKTSVGQSQSSFNIFYLVLIVLHNSPSMTEIFSNILEKFRGWEEGEGEKVGLASKVRSVAG